MDAFEAVVTKLESREFDTKRPVPKDVKLKVLDAARSTASGMNTQEWRFILVQDPKDLKMLADDSTTGQWVSSANFAVIVLTEPKYAFHLIDAGRAVQNMQVAEWGYGVSSRVFTGINDQKMRRDFGIPSNYQITIVVGFGYPAQKVTGKKKNRAPLDQVAYLEKYGNKLDPAKVT
jgi:nitroreductase